MKQNTVLVIDTIGLMYWQINSFIWVFCSKKIGKFYELGTGMLEIFFKEVIIKRRFTDFVVVQTKNLLERR